MAQHLLDETDVRAPFQHQRRHGVAEEVARPTLAKLRRLHIAPHQGTEVVRVERPTSGGEEQGAAIRGADQAGPHLRQVPGDPREGARPDRHEAVPPPLALPDQDEPPAPIEIGHSQPDELRTTHTGRIERLQDGAIADPQRSLE